ncbi:dephospho-CoA kinase [Nanoarchaeota archaeon]
MITPIYALSADPIHYGHLNTIKHIKNLKCFGDTELIIAVGNNEGKKYMFNQDERVVLARSAIESLRLKNVTVEGFDGFLYKYANKHPDPILVRSGRNGKDFEFEKNLSNFNKQMYKKDFGKDLNTIVLPAENDLVNVSSTLVRESIRDKKFVNDYVPPVIKQALEEKVHDTTLIGVTGNMGSGKTTLCNYLASNDNLITHIDVDKIVHSFYVPDSPYYDYVRTEIEKNFGSKYYQNDVVDKFKMRELVFDRVNRSSLLNILEKPTLKTLQQEVYNHKGIVLVDVAYLVENELMDYVNNNVILAQCSEHVRQQRINNRDKKNDDVRFQNSDAQYPLGKKKSKIMFKIQNDKYGTLYNVNTEKNESSLILNKRIFPVFNLHTKMERYINGN